jgi:hypothetical protein
LPIKLKSLTTSISGECPFYKEVPRIFGPIAKYFQYNLKSSPYIIFCNSEKDASHGYLDDPTTAGARAVAGEAAVIPVPDLDQGTMTPEEQPHRPWLVPGAGTL